MKDSLSWKKSPASGADRDCVEWAVSSDSPLVHVRHSKDPDGPVLTFTKAEWEAFTLGVKQGLADL